MVLNWTRTEKSTWELHKVQKVCKKCILGVHVQGHHVYLDMTLYLSAFLFPGLDIYASAIDLGWFYQMVWWEEFGFD